MLSFSRILRAKVIQRQIRDSLSKPTYCTQKVASERPEEIEIPNYIERSPTDILEALAGTIKRDPTAVHFKYHDDPYLIPMSNIGKRTFALAQESGRKAARWIMQENPQLFQHKVADPPIEAFIPKQVFTEDSEVDADCLRRLIRDNEVTDAMFVYRLMVSKNIEVPSQMKLDLLELVAFYNHEDPIPETHVEERWFKQGISGRDRIRRTWKDGDLAEELFNVIEPKDERAYSALICGMCKYYQVERAWALFQQAREKELVLDTEAYNGVISVCNFLKESADLRWELCWQLLQEMSQNNVPPNLGTMNAVLNLLTVIGNNKMARKTVPRLLNEFKELGIEPSLGTWYYVLKIFCRERGPVSSALVEILGEIGEKEFQIMDAKDVFFFSTAMDVCRSHLKDKNLAYRLNNLLHFGNNYDFIGDSLKESAYYRNFLGVVCENGTLDEFVELYNQLVPTIYIPESGIIEEALKMIEINGALELIPKMWSDMIMFDHAQRENLVNQILTIMVNNRPNADIDVQKGLDEKFAVIAWDIFTKIRDTSEDKKNKITFTGQLLGDILSLLIRGDNFEQANEVFEKLEKNQHLISGTPSETCLNEFVDICITNKRPSRCMTCLQYCVEAGYQNGNEIAEKMIQAFTIDEASISKIRSLVGGGLAGSQKKVKE